PAWSALVAPHDFSQAVAAMTRPPRAGPDTLANCQPLLFQVTALPSASGGTTCGSRELRAGAGKAPAPPASSRQTKPRPTGPRPSDRAASPSEATAAVVWPIWNRVLRL